MRHPHRNVLARAGFTLIEVLVTLVLVGLLVGVVVPSVLNQLGAGEPTRLAGDLEGLRSGVRLFRVDVKRFPGKAHQVVLHPTDWDVTGPTVDTDSLPFSSAVLTPPGDNIPTGLLARWNGPYLEGAQITGTGTATPVLNIALGYTVENEFFAAQFTTTGPEWIVANVVGPTLEQTQAVSEVIDGNTDETTGRVRWDGGGSKLQFYMTPNN